MKITPFQNSILISRNSSLIDRLVSPKLTGESILIEMIKISKQLRNNMCENQIEEIYKGFVFPQLIHKHLKKNSNLFEDSLELSIQQPIRGLTKPKSIINKDELKLMQQYLTFKDFEKYTKLPQDTKFSQSLSRIHCSLDNFTNTYTTNSEVQKRLNQLLLKESSSKIFKEVVEILTPNSIIQSVNTGYRVDEQLFNLQGNIFSIKLNNDNNTSNRRKDIGKYYSPCFELLTSWTVNKFIVNEYSSLVAHTFLDDPSFIKDIFETKYNYTLNKFISDKLCLK